MKEIIKAIIKDFHNRGTPEIVERDIKIPFKSGKIVTIIGPRRTGKTYLMYQTISKIPDITNVIYINFEDERLEFSSNNLNLIMESYFEMYPNKKENNIIFFFDEIQEVKGWEKFVRRIYDSVSKDIFITGSSSKLLSKEIATSLRGRTITYEVLPLSFNEYLRFKKIEKDTNSTKGKATLISNLNHYIEKGSFPETINMNKETYQKTLPNYFEVMLYRDVIERYNVTNTLPLKLLIKKLVANSSKEFTINKIFNTFKSEGIKISKDTLYQFLNYFEDSYILIIVMNFSESLTKQQIKKSYSIDNGLSSILSFTLSKDKGSLFENIILLELKRRGNEIFYYKNNFECDFVIKKKDKISEAIQVCYNLNENNEKRELDGLKEAMKRFKLKKGVIVTLDQEKKIENIDIIPAYKWLIRY